MDSIFKIVTDEMLASHGWILYGAFLAAVSFSSLLILTISYKMKQMEKRIIARFSKGV